jgi:peptidoglycan/xylan/chitin deacetylase (PgdA/CDA1 family)
MIRNKLYYALKPFIPRRLQIIIRRQIVSHKLKIYQDIWPIDPNSSTPPKNWQGWPDKKKFALVLSHDVDTQKGCDSVISLMEIEEKLGFKSSYNFVPERYKISHELIQKVKDRGFQVCIHGLKHDGKLFNSRKIFNERARLINHYLKEWKSIGFTSPSMHHNLEWMHILNILHSTSTFDTDPFEPQPDSIRTIFPFRVANSRQINGGYIELPYTLPQDHLLFVIMQNKNINIWKKKVDWIAENGGMALLNTHSDYMNLDGSKLSLEEYPGQYYINFLEFIKSKYQDQYWLALPRDIVSFWIQHIK